MGEALIQKQIIKYLQLRGFKVYKISDRFRSGIPDLYAVRDGISHWLEVKKPGEGPTKLQALELKQLRDAGASAHVVRSVEDVDWIIRDGKPGPDPVAAYSKAFSHGRSEGFRLAREAVEEMDKNANIIKQAVLQDVIAAIDQVQL